MAGRPGFEPGLTGSEPVVLPLNYLPSGRGFPLEQTHHMTGWETWIRTRADRVRAGSSTAKLSPKRRLLEGF
ncbi:hypothetical protein SACS_1281 [Parasaccharibacter apium]|uniref:Uncharacterized protein n=1 Tax=Parasaccharibacter apium TaxID=1510841 RepID=A0A7U7G6I7_9PROT|nr:hypothetical protein SACS_1281 [Parasaccharibacter apium]